MSGIESFEIWVAFIGLFTKQMLALNWKYTSLHFSNWFTLDFFSSLSIFKIHQVAFIVKQLLYQISCCLVFLSPCQRKLKTQIAVLQRQHINGGGCGEDYEVSVEGTAIDRLAKH